MRIESTIIQSFGIDPFDLKDGESGFHPTLKLKGDLDGDTAAELGCYDAMYAEESKVTSCKVERKDTAVRLSFYPINGANGKKPLHEIEVAGVHTFSASRKGVDRKIGFSVSFEKGADLMTSFLMNHPGWVGAVEIEPLQGELFADKTAEAEAEEE